MNLNFLYCFDNNFNLQALTSIHSLLGKVSEKITLHIIHNDISEFKTISKGLDKNEMINKINYYDFSYDLEMLPTISTHISKATYYRLFISEYLNKKVKNLIYLDADIICIKDPIPDIKNCFNLMKNENKELSAYVESTREKNPDLFNRLNLKNNNQFNAGVLLIDFEKWTLNNTSNKLSKILNERSDELFDYDQEVLNVCFDDNFTKLEKKFNFQVTNQIGKSYLETVKREAVFVHYLGKDKPWHFNRILLPSSMIYQNEFRNLFNKQLHIIFNLNKRNVLRFLKIIFTFSFLKFKYPGSYLKYSFIAIFKK